MCVTPVAVTRSAKKLIGMSAILSCCRCSKNTGDPTAAIGTALFVSGGKDCTYQVVRMLQLRLNPLCVTSTTCDFSPLGRKNIENLKHLGIDYVEISPNPLILAKLNSIGLKQVGDISWPEHVGIFTIPVRVALQFNVPLLVWGENPQNEYGGAQRLLETTYLIGGG